MAQAAFVTGRENKCDVCFFAVAWIKKRREGVCEKCDVVTLSDSWL